MAAKKNIKKVPTGSTPPNGSKKKDVAYGVPGPYGRSIASAAQKRDRVIFDQYMKSGAYQPGMANFGKFAKGIMSNSNTAGYVLRETGKKTGDLGASRAYSRGVARNRRSGK